MVKKTIRIIGFVLLGLFFLWMMLQIEHPIPVDSQPRTIEAPAR